MANGRFSECTTTRCNPSFGPGSRRASVPARQGDAFEAATSQIPGIERRKNPNIILAPRTANGITELRVMLASLLPDDVLRKAGIEHLRANMALALTGRYQMQKRYASIVEQTFAQYIGRNCLFDGIPVC